MPRSRTRTLGKTPTMAFVLDYLREFPGAQYPRVKAAAQAAGLGVPAPVIYGNALRVLRKEAEPDAPITAGQPVPQRRGRRHGHALQDLVGLVAQLQAVVAERDHLRGIVDQIRDVVKQLRG